MLIFLSFLKIFFIITTPLPFLFRGGKDKSRGIIFPKVLKTNILIGTVLFIKLI